MRTYEQIFGTFGRKLDEGILSDRQKDEAFAHLAETCICKVTGMSAEELCEDVEWEPAMKVKCRCADDETIKRAVHHTGETAELLHTIVTTIGLIEPQVRVEMIVTVKGMTSEEVDQMDGEYVPVGAKVTD